MFRSAVIALGMTALFSGFAIAQDTDPDVEAIERELAQLETRMEALRSQLESAMEATETDRKSSGFRFGGGKDAVGRDGERRVYRMVEDPDALRDAARGIEEALEEADIFLSLANLMIAVSEDVVVVEDDDSVTLSFKGRDVASVESVGDDRMTVRAMGRKLSIEMD